LRTSLVQATCLRAIERADQFASGTRLDRWLFAILRSIWLSDIRARGIREGGGFVAAEDVLTSDGAHEIEMKITASAVIRVIGNCRKPSAKPSCSSTAKDTATRKRRRR
jgi:RNA polymerase sigma-70 factor, ECF subfamily